MSEDKHTPGPWMVIFEDGHHVFDESEHEVEANARLIAAAPDLLAALRFVAERAGYGLRAADEAGDLAEAADCLSSCETEALDAIRKAAGESNA